MPESELTVDGQQVREALETQNRKNRLAEIHQKALEKRQARDESKAHATHANGPKTYGINGVRVKQNGNDTVIDGADLQNAAVNAAAGAGLKVRLRAVVESVNGLGETVISVRTVDVNGSLVPE